jgi:ferredoxin-NADP reductase/Na+-translocating ferredoxin:NAD+ oxidoreductase RnfD subunit
MKLIDKFLNGITMYRLVMWGLGILVVLGAILSFAGTTGLDGVGVLGGAAVLIVVALLTNEIYSRLLSIPTAPESPIITALILALIMYPPAVPLDYTWVALAAVVAVSSKYLLALRDKQIFNPAAISLVAIGWAGYSGALWWVGNKWLIIPVAILGLAVVRKLRRFDTLVPFVVMAVLATILHNNFAHPWDDLSNLIISGPLIFLGCIMLTEPSTIPPHRPLRIGYGILVGLLIGFYLNFGIIHTSPQLALVVGNLFSFAVGFKRRVKLQLQGVQIVGNGVYDLTFVPGHPFAFAPGQYMEWTMSHARSDSRGNRRYFTIASSPTEGVIKLGMRFDPQHASSYKKALTALAPGGVISATGLAGDFTLPHDMAKKLVFIAGGVGITPFRAMVKYLIDMGQKRDVTLFYNAQAADGFAYADIFNQALQLGLVRTYYVINGPVVPEGWQGLSGFLTPELVKQCLPDFAVATYYISGPPVMVSNYVGMLTGMGVPRARIRTDYFPGY